MEQKISDLIAKNVITFENGQCVGYVLNVCFDSFLSKIEGFVVADDESEHESFLSYDDVKVFGEDSLFVDDASVLSFLPLQESSPVGKKVYDAQGNIVGRILDVILQGRRVASFVLDTCFLPARAISSCGVDCLFFDVKRKKTFKKISNFEQNNAKILPKSEIMISSTKISAPTNSVKVQMPQKMTLTPSTLLNKTATADILGLNNEIIVKCGQKIDQKKIDQAKKHGKINLLILNSK